MTIAYHLQCCRKLHHSHPVQMHSFPANTFHCNVQSFTAIYPFQSTGNSTITPFPRTLNCWSRKWEREVVFWQSNRYVIIMPATIVVSARMLRAPQVTVLSSSWTVRNRNYIYTYANVLHYSFYYYLYVIYYFILSVRSAKQTQITIRTNPKSSVYS